MSWTLDVDRSGFSLQSCWWIHEIFTILIRFDTSLWDGLKFSNN
jgi:hypothetical protein